MKQKNDLFWDYLFSSTATPVNWWAPRMDYYYFFEDVVKCHVNCKGKCMVHFENHIITNHCWPLVLCQDCLKQNISIKSLISHSKSARYFFFYYPNFINKEIHSKSISWKFLGGPGVKILCFHCWGPGSIPGWGTKIPQAMWCGQKKKKKILVAIIKH